MSKTKPVLFLKIYSLILLAWRQLIWVRMLSGALCVQLYSYSCLCLYVWKKWMKQDVFQFFRNSARVLSFLASIAEYELSEGLWPPGLYFDMTVLSFTAVRFSSLASYPLTTEEPGTLTFFSSYNYYPMSFQNNHVFLLTETSSCVRVQSQFVTRVARKACNCRGHCGVLCCSGHLARVAVQAPFGLISVIGNS